MKRHLFKLPQYPKSLTKRREIKNLIYKYIRDQQLFVCDPARFAAVSKLGNIHPNLSKVKTFCLVTGRVHFTVKEPQISRHIFFEYCREGHLPGYFFGS